MRLHDDDTPHLHELSAEERGRLSESIWKLLKRKDDPPLTRFAVWASGLECTINDALARDELGYREVTSREAGLAELRA